MLEFIVSWFYLKQFLKLYGKKGKQSKTQKSSNFLRKNFSLQEWEDVGNVSFIYTLYSGNN